MAGYPPVSPTQWQTPQCESRVRALGLLLACCVTLGSTRPLWASVSSSLEHGVGQWDTSWALLALICYFDAREAAGVRSF